MGVCPLFSFKEPEIPTREAAVVDRVRAVAGRVATSSGLELFDVEYKREAQGWIVRVLLDRPGPAATAEDSVSVEDCARVSRELSAILDVEDFIPTAYTLEVSSPGLDRPLRGADDYRRFAGRLAKLVTRVPVDGQTFFRCRLGGVEDQAVVFEDEGGRRHRVPLDAITRANLEVEF